MSEQNYSEPISQGATVAGLKTVGGDGVFFLDAHGGLANGKFVVTTAELESLDLEKENPSGTGSYDDDLKNGRLVCHDRSAILSAGDEELRIAAEQHSHQDQATSHEGVGGRLGNR